MSDTPSLDRLLRARRAVMHGRTRDGQLPPVPEDPYAQEIIDFARNLERENADLRAKLEEATKDAERYRFACKHTDGWWPMKFNVEKIEIDSAIDAAIAQGKGEK